MTAKVVEVPSWSHSSMSTFRNCPKQYWHLKVERDIQESQNEAATWGNAVHEKIELRLKLGPLDGALPDEFVMYEAYCQAIERCAGTMYVEEQLALTENLTPCNWYDSKAWVRAIIDVMHLDGTTARLMDHKTGKRKTDSRQLKLSALMVFHTYPNVMTIKTGFFWLKENARDIETYTRDQIPALWESFRGDLNAFKTAFATNTWQPRESGLCKGWCPVKSCMFWEPKREKK